MIRSSARLAGVACLATLLSLPTTSQTCSNTPGTFFKNDNLAATGGLSTFSVIPGLCEGEAAGAVFQLAPGAPPQTLRELAVGFGSNGGASGATALLNVEIYDGVTFPGGVPLLGPKVFDLNADTGNDMQVTSTAINVFDATPYNVVVGNGTSNFVVAFRMGFNPNGNCTTGFNSNFITDNGSPGFFCNPAITPPQKNLIFILGQGWQDASTATVQGFPLCPLFYAGNWVIRACTTDAAPANPLQVAVTGSPAPPGGTVFLTFNAPGFQGVPYLAAASFGNTPGTPIPGGTIPLNYDGMLELSLTTPSVFVQFSGLISALTGTASGLINVPPLPLLSGLSFYVAFITIPPSPVPFGISDAALVSIF